MIICSVNIGHYSSLCVFKNDTMVWYSEESKLTKNKNSGGIPYACIDLLSNKNFKIDQLLITGYNYDAGHAFSLETYFKYKKINIPPKSFCYVNPHHLSHLFKAYIDSKFKKATIFVIDSRGSDWQLSDNLSGYETTSVYTIDPDQSPPVKCLYKNIYVEESFKSNSVKKNNGLFIDKDTKFNVSNKLDLGMFYSAATFRMNFKDHEEGKFMGWQSYGKFDEELYEKLKNQITFEEVKNIPVNQDAAHTCQVYFENKYLELVEKFKSDNMIFTGGTALNVVNNYKLKKKFLGKNLYFEPLCGDEGNCIGTAYLYLFLANIKPKPLSSIYIGGESKNFIFDTYKNVEISEVVNLLEKGNVVGLFQGKTEGGPRALGNRSLLLDPTIINAKDIMNSIKKRESYRPFACSILEENANDYFEMLDIKKSPHMMYAAQAKKLAQDKIPSLVHADNTCRLQTINKEQNLVLYKLLKNFKIPILMNTSFNLAGYAMNETIEDALLTLKDSELKYIYFADFNILCKKTK